MCTEPLSDYFKLVGEKPDFELQHTACRRGYEGTWEICDRRLYLIDLSGITKTGETVSLGSLFPDFAKRVFANWYTGTVRLPQGKMLEYIHGGYASIYERDLFIEFDKGAVTRTYERVNVVAPKKRRGLFGRLWAVLTFSY